MAVNLAPPPEKANISSKVDQQIQQLQDIQDTVARKAAARQRSELDWAPAAAENEKGMNDRTALYTAAQQQRPWIEGSDAEVSKIARHIFDTIRKEHIQLNEQLTQNPRASILQAASQDPNRVSRQTDMEATRYGTRNEQNSMELQQQHCIQSTGTQEVTEDHLEPNQALPTRASGMEDAQATNRRIILNLAQQQQLRLAQLGMQPATPNGKEMTQAMQGVATNNKFRS